MAKVFLNPDQFKTFVNQGEIQLQIPVEPPAPFDPCDDGLDVLWASGELQCPHGQVGDPALVKEVFEDTIAIFRVKFAKWLTSESIDKMDRLGSGVFPSSEVLYESRSSSQSGGMVG